MERICPSLANVGPSSSSAPRSRRADSWWAVRSSASERPKSSLIPYLVITAGDVERAAHEARLPLRLLGKPAAVTSHAIEASAARCRPYRESAVLTMITVHRAL